MPARSRATRRSAAPEPLATCGKGHTERCGVRHVEPNARGMTPPRLSPSRASPGPFSGRGFYFSPLAVALADVRTLRHFPPDLGGHSRTAVVLRQGHNPASEHGADPDVRPTTPQLTGRLGHDGWILEPMRWGLVPFWRSGKPLKDTAKGADDGFKLTTFNARVETCHSASTFRDAFANRVKQ